MAVPKFRHPKEYSGKKSVESGQKTTFARDSTNLSNSPPKPVKPMGAFDGSSLRKRAEMLCT
jgi:hypothetical protein